jgi:hypothetical protein
MGERINAYQIMVLKAEGKIPLGRTRHRRENDMNKDLKETGQECVDRTHLA